MVLLLGASGYVGRAFATELRRRSQAFIPLTRSAMDYSDFNLLFDYLRRIRPQFLINAAGFTGRPGEGACEGAHEQTLAANVLLPQTVARACAMTNTPWGHVSSGSIYSGAKVVENGRMRIERDLNQSEIRAVLAEHPEKIFGFNEWDEPNASFRCGPCSFYSGSKALAEEAIQEIGQGYIWRPGLPFNERPEPRNLLWRLQHSEQIADTVNSLSHIDDFVRACLDLWKFEAPFGKYNVNNRGALTGRQIMNLIERTLKQSRPVEFFEHPARVDGPETRLQDAHSVLDNTKLIAAGIKIRSAEDALEDALQNWQTVSPVVELLT